MLGVEQVTKTAIGKEDACCDVSKIRSGEKNDVTKSSSTLGKGEEARSSLQKLIKRKWVSNNKYLLSSPLDKKKKKKKKSKTVKPEDEQKTENSNEKKVACELCEKQFSSKCALLKHVKIHTGLKAFQCDSCDKKFATKFALERHNFVHNPCDPKFKFVCNICDKRFATKEWLAGHSRAHTGEMPFECDYCKKKFSSQGTLNRHALSHKNEKSFLCNECGKMYNSEQTLRLHIACHVSERTFNCSKCRLKFKRDKDLRRHQVVHKEISVIPCPLLHCKHEFRRKDNLLRHLRLTHDQTRDEAHETYNSLISSKGSCASSLGEKSPSSRSKVADGIGQAPKQSPASKVRGKRKSRKQPNKGKPNNKQQQLEPINSTEEEIHPEVEITDSTTTSQEPDLPQPPVENKKQRSVTTSVIRMAKSAQPTTNQPCRKRYKRLEYQDDEDHETPSRPKSPYYDLYSTSVPLSYPPRIPSPGHEYINYLNSLNPLPYRPKAQLISDRSSSLNYRDTSTSFNYNHSQFPISNSLNQFLPATYTYPDTERVNDVARSSDLFNPTSTAFTGFESENSTNTSEMVYQGQVDFPDHTAAIYANANNTHPFDFSSHDIQQSQCFQLEESSLGYLDLSSTRRRDDGDVEPFTYSQLHHLPFESSSPVYQDYLTVQAMPQEISVGNVNLQQPSYERPANVTVIKRASASHHHQNEPQNFEFSHFMPQMEIPDGPIPDNLRPMLNLPSTSSEATETGVRTRNKSGVLGIGGKDMIVNRDPRKNFLWENFSRNQSQD